MVQFGLMMMVTIFISSSGSFANDIYTYLAVTILCFCMMLESQHLFCVYKTSFIRYPHSHTLTLFKKLLPL